MDAREQEVLARVEARRRRGRGKLLDERITLSHGAGGKATHALIEALLLRHLGNPLLDPLGDSATFAEGDGETCWAFSTDSFVVRPRFFPGGDIGELAVNGTVNDLAMAGARPLYLSLALILEEGLPTEELERILASVATAAAAAEVVVATGDTKVVERGRGDGVYITTAGVGVLHGRVRLGADQVRPGDQVIVSGTIGDHGMAVMVARGDLELEAELASDTAPLHGLVGELLGRAPGTRWLRDPTRGGVATALNELAGAAGLGIVIDEAALPIRPQVNGACEILGLDPLYVANEGKLLAVVAPEDGEIALAALRAHPLGRDAAVIAHVCSDPPGMVLLDTAFGGTRVVDMLAGDPLPRIC